MRKLILLPFLYISQLAAQSPLSFGIKAGVPVNSAISGGSNIPGFAFSSVNRDWVFGGPSVEFRLNPRWSIEFDALYRRLRYELGYSLLSPAPTPPAGSTYMRSRANSWDFPLLLKRRLSEMPLRPYLVGGISTNLMANRHTDSSTVSSGAYYAGSYDESTRWRAGMTVGGGIELSAGKLNIAPEIRYTSWGRETVDYSISRSQRNQVDFVVGFHF